MFPYRDDNPTLATPIVTLLLIAANVVVWVLVQGMGSEPNLSRSVCELGLIPGELLGRLPERFHAFQWHYYTHDLPAGAVELARSRICTQAFRLGENAWGVQFHPEVTLRQVQGWADERDEPKLDYDALMAETVERIADWNALGRELCEAFVTVAERVATAA